MNSNINDEPAFKRKIFMKPSFIYTSKYSATFKIKYPCKRCQFAIYKTNINLYAESNKKIWCCYLFCNDSQPTLLKDIVGNTCFKKEDEPLPCWQCKSLIRRYEQFNEENNL
jgi:hypothetical protein